MPSRPSWSTRGTSSPRSSACPRCGPTPSTWTATRWSRALSRPLIVRHLVAAAARYGATIVSHGCTGKGNDQVRFEVGIADLGPAPEGDRAGPRLRLDPGEGHRVRRGAAACRSRRTRSRPYSIDQNVWGRAVETGFLEDIWNAPIEDVYAYTADPSAPREPDEVTITFEAGVPVAIDGEKVTMLQAIQQLNERAGAQGVGRLDMVEDRLVGIKSREVYEAPGAMALIAAHMELENVTIERELARFKRGVGPALGRAGLRRPVVLTAEAGAGHLHRRGPAGVSGDIRMVLHGGKATVTGRRSDVSLYDFNLATYDEGDRFDQSQARGFIEIYGMSSKLAARRDAGSAG